MSGVRKMIVVCCLVFLWVATEQSVASSQSGGLPEVGRKGLGGGALTQSPERVIPSERKVGRTSMEIPTWTVFPGGWSSGNGFGLAVCLGQSVVGQAAGGTALVDAGFLAAAGGGSRIFSDGFETADTGAWDATVGSVP